MTPENVTEFSPDVTHNQINKTVQDDRDVIQDLKEKVSFEDALKMTGVGRYNIGLLAISIYTCLAACAEIFSVGTIVTTSQCDLELDIFRKGLINSVPLLGCIAGSNYWGYLADTRGRRYTLLICTAGTMVMSLLSSFANHWIYMTIAKFSSALFAFGTNAIIYALLGESTPESHRGQYLLYTATGVMFAQTVIAMITYPTLHLEFSYYLPCLNFYFRPWRLTTILIGLTSGLNFILLKLFAFESPKFYFARGEHDKGLEMLEKIYSANMENNATSFPIKCVDLGEHIQSSTKRNILRSMWDQTAPLFSKKHIKNTLLICYICLTVYCIGPPFSIWLPEIVNSYSETNGSSTSFCKMFQENVAVSKNSTETVCNDNVAEITFAVLAGFGLYLPIVSITSVFCIKYTGKKWMYVGIHVCSALCAVIINNVDTLWGILALTGMMGNAVCIGITTFYAVELFPTYMRAMAVCLTIMIARLVSFGFAIVIGTQLLNNCSNFLYILSAFIFSGAAVGLLLPSDRKKKDKPADVENTSTSKL